MSWEWRKSELLVILGQCAILAVVTTALIFPLATFPEAGVLVDRPRFGIDWFIYWSAYNFAKLGHSPYFHQALQEFQQGYTIRPSAPALNTPIVLGLFAPLFELNLFHSTISFLVLNLFLLFSSIRIGLLLAREDLLPSLPGKSDLHLSVFSLLTFLPALDLISFGQFSAVALFGLLVAVYGFRRQRYFASGALLALALVKPHLVVLPTLVLLIQAFTERRFSFFLGAALGALLVFSLPELVLPGIYLDYINAPTTTERWVPASLFAPLALSFSSVPHTTLLVFFAILGLLGVILSFRIRAPEHKKLELALLLNALLTPYSHVFDHAVLTPIWATLLSSCKTSSLIQTMIRLLLLAGFFLLTILSHVNNIVDWRLWWLPTVLALLWFFERVFSHSQPLRPGSNPAE